jgi:hypothetical protein
MSLDLIATMIGRAVESAGLHLRFVDETQLAIVTPEQAAMFFGLRALRAALQELGPVRGAAEAFVGGASLGELLRDALASRSDAGAALRALARASVAALIGSATAAPDGDRSSGRTSLEAATNRTMAL